MQCNFSFVLLTRFTFPTPPYLFAGRFLPVRGRSRDGYPGGGPARHIPLEFLDVVGLPPAEQRNDLLGYLGALGSAIQCVTGIEHLTGHI